ncbi:peptidase domain-containing ABC transporter [Puia sp. P3]|uniref:peptidase domain-containing ABC transporter n=1 Tax=Puia sp. P3 TaxID=3423952 RepID=UPI003D67D16B
MKHIRQYDAMDCGPSCLAMIADYYGKKYSLQYLRDSCHITKEGVSLLGITEAAHAIGLETTSALVTPEQLAKINQPCILHWNQNHFVVLKHVGKGRKRWRIADPGHGMISLSDEKFVKAWIGEGRSSGIVLLLEPTEKFYELDPSGGNSLSVKYLVNYLKAYSRQLMILFSLLLLGSLITFVFPFLSRSLIDRGVSGKNIGIIKLILLAQLALFTGTIVIEIFRNWIMLVIGTKLSINIISDFLEKMLKLPMKFFETKMMGDFNQRIQDNERIEYFLTSQSLLTLFSLITFSVFLGVLSFYDYKVLLIYIGLTALSVGWSLYFLKRRKTLDYYRFQHQSSNQESIYEILNGVTEMKLNNFEDYKRFEWRKIQHKLFQINIKILKNDQLQLSGFDFLNQLKNILVTFLGATFVVRGTMTLGTLLSISYIIGQMNAPISQLVGFFKSLQNARLSLDRLNEVQNHPDEERPTDVALEPAPPHRISRGIELRNLSFQYEGPRSPYVLKNVSLHLPHGKVTAIVGASGSGKTSLLKLLLKFYPPTHGQILYDGMDIGDLSARSLRGNVGVVMQDGFIFSDTIERNIATGDDTIDTAQLERAVKIANIESFIAGLPLQYKTKIGAAGNPISGGQRQRILIARAVYKNPHYIFFDEATSALDAENEKVIHGNLTEFFRGKTVVIIAHRLSTVKNADNIVVLKGGEVVENGNHTKLIGERHVYFNLVKNQLELGA